MAKPVALLLNDTSGAYHWGCYGTSMELHLSLEELGYSVDSVGVADIHNLTTGPTTETHFTDDSFRRVFMHDHEELISRIESAAVVIVNGEGTLHGLRRSAFNLLYLIRSASHLGKPVHVINTSIYPFSDGSFNEGAARLYRTALAEAKSICVREPESHSVCHASDIHADLSFDCLPRFIARGKTGQSGEDPHTQTIVLGAGFGLTPDIFADLLRAASDVLSEYALLYVTGANGPPASDDAPFADLLSHDGRLNVTVKEVTTFADWCQTLASADAVVSGRFHHTIAAVCLGTPVLVFEAGTPKNHGLCKALGLQAPLPADPDSSEVFRKRVAKILNEGRSSVSPEVISDLRDQAGNNFRSIDGA